MNIFESIAKLGNCVTLVTEVAKQIHRGILSNIFYKEEAGENYRKQNTVF